MDPALQVSILSTNQTGESLTYLLWKGVKSVQAPDLASDRQVRDEVECCLVVVACFGLLLRLFLALFELFFHARVDVENVNFSAQE
jgi:hypothetical protein